MPTTAAPDHPNYTELVLLDEFLHIAHYWWLVTLMLFLGGLGGYLFHLSKPAIYEAKATFYITIDQDRFPFQAQREDLIQYNEDMALQTAEGALYSLPVRQAVLAEASQQGIVLDDYNLIKNSTIERRQDTWDVRFRSQEPAAAQVIANLWAETGYQAMLEWQASGKSPSFVIFNPPIPAPLPQQPAVYGRNSVMLAGSLIGFLVGVLTIATLRRSSRRSTTA